MHIRNDAAYSHVTRATMFLQKSSIYVGELDLDDPLLLDVQDYFLLPSHMSLMTLYGEHKYYRIRNILLKSFDFDIDDYLDLKPMIVANMIAEKVLTAQYDLSLDHYLWGVAKDLNKPLYGLESGKDQIEVLDEIGLDIQKEMLSKIAKNVSRYTVKVSMLSQYYEEEKISQLYKSTKKSLGKLRKQLLYTRNHQMADKVVEYTSDSKAFVAVGAAHLGGKFGLLRLMKKSGYKIKAV